MAERTQLHTVNEVCERLKLCRETLHQLVCRGEIKRVKIGKAVRFTNTEIERFIAKHTRV